MNTYTVVWPVEHDGRRYEIGDTIELSEAAAAPLLADFGSISGPIEVPAEAAPVGKGGKSA